MLSQEKQKKLAYVARRYYLENQRQSDIAKELGVSRPLVSRMLSEARELGVVEITIHEPGARAERLMERLHLYSAIQNGVLIEDGKDEDETNRALSQGAVELLQNIGTQRLGVGWGYLIGQLVTCWRQILSKTAPSQIFARWLAMPISLLGITNPMKMSA